MLYRVITRQIPTVCRALVVFVRSILIANAFDNSGACNLQSQNLSIKLVPTVAMAGSFVKWTYRDLVREDLTNKK